MSHPEWEDPPGRAEVKTPGRVACEEWTRFHGSPSSFRPWDALPRQVRAAWEAVALAVLSAAGNTANQEEL